MKLNHAVCLTISLVLPLLCPAQTPPKYTISTVAGNGTAGFTGDGGAATGAELSNPLGILLDSSGNLYIADQVNHRIRKMDAGGMITTWAGNGTGAYLGDSGAATSAELYDPAGMVMDSSGNLYIADSHNHVVRKVASNGTITTFAGDGVSGFSGDTAAATSGDTSLATDATLNTPMAVALDSAGNLYIADTFNQRIRKVTSDGNINTVVGTGTAGSAGDGGPALSARLNYPESIAFDAAGNLYIADTMNDRIRMVSAADGTIITIAGSVYYGFGGDGGPASAAQLNYPKGIAFDAAGNLYIADSFNSRIRMISAADGTIRTIAGNGAFGARGDGGPATSAQLRFPTGVAVDSAGKVYVSDTQNSTIRLLTPVLPPASSASSPAINVGGVVSSKVFGGFSAIAPGSWIEIYGSNLAAETRGWSAADFNGSTAPTALGGTRVTIGGQDAYLAYVSPTEIVAVAPSSAPVGSQPLLVATTSGTSQPYRVTVSATQPGLFAPSGSNLGSVRPGDTITLYGIGFGPVTPQVDAGEIAPASSALELPLQFVFGGAPATLAYAGLAPGSVGLYQFNVVVPGVAAGGATPLTFTLGGVSGEQTLYVAVEN